MARKNQQIYVGCHSPQRGELIAAVYELWLRALNTSIDRSAETISLRTLHRRTLCALLRDGLALLSGGRAATMADAILDALEAHCAAHCAAHRLRPHAFPRHFRDDLAKARERVQRYGYGTLSFDAGLVLHFLVDWLVDAVLLDGMPLDAAIALTDPDPDPDRAPAAAKAEEAAA